MSLRRARRLARIAALACAVLACGDSGPGDAPADGGAPPPADEAPETAPQTVDAAAGAATYRTYCAACHGATGDGDTPFAKTLDPPPTAHSNGAYMNALTDDYLFRLISQGGAAVGKSPAMAPWGGALSDAQIRNVIAHIRSLADPATP